MWSYLLVPDLLAALLDEILDGIQEAFLAFGAQPQQLLFQQLKSHVQWIEHDQNDHILRGLVLAVVVSNIAHVKICEN